MFLGYKNHAFSYLLCQVSDCCRIAVIDCWVGRWRLWPFVTCFLRRLRRRPHCCRWWGRHASSQTQDAWAFHCDWRYSEREELRMTGIRSFFQHFFNGPYLESVSTIYRVSMMIMAWMNLFFIVVVVVEPEPPVTLILFCTLPSRLKVCDLNDFKTDSRL